MGAGKTPTKQLLKTDKSRTETLAVPKTSKKKKKNATGWGRAVEAWETRKQKQGQTTKTKRQGKDTSQLGKLHQWEKEPPDGQKTGSSEKKKKLLGSNTVRIKSSEKRTLQKRKKKKQKDPGGKVVEE